MQNKTPWWFWAIAGVGLLWNLIGAADYTMTHLQVDAYLAPFTPEEKAYFLGFPAWADVCWALGSWSCVIGSLLLLLRNKTAVTAFAFSLLGLFGTTVYQFTGATPDSLNRPFTWLFTALIWLTILGLLYFSYRMRRRGILR